MLGGSEASFLNVRNEIEEQVKGEDGDANETSDADGDECQAQLAEVEAVDVDVYEGKHLEEGVVYPVGQSGLCGGAVSWSSALV